MTGRDWREQLRILQAELRRLGIRGKTYDLVSPYAAPRVRAVDDGPPVRVLRQRERERA